MALKSLLQKLHWFGASQLGVDPRRFLNSLLGAPAFILGWKEFSRSFSGKMEIMPCLYDKYEEAGSIKNEYFWQDLYVAREIYQMKPARHVDIGSRVDGFVAHLASFREVDVMDVRPISIEVPGIRFIQADLMNLVYEKFNNFAGAYDSLSCLHALEHFGLGRYGDPINTSGYALGFTNMTKLLATNGRFFLSVPIGRERVIYNANWIFNPRTILGLAESHGLKLESFVAIDPLMGPKNILLDEAMLDEIAKKEYLLGVFNFIKMP